MTNSSTYAIWISACAHEGFSVPVTVIRRRPCGSEPQAWPLYDCCSMTEDDVVDVYMLPGDTASPPRPQPAALARLQENHPGCQLVYG